MKPVSYFIAVFRRAFYGKHFDIKLMALVVMVWKLSAYFHNTAT